MNLLDCTTSSDNRGASDHASGGILNHEVYGVDPCMASSNKVEHNMSQNAIWQTCATIGPFPTNCNYKELWDSL